jgi:hypothetical protein
VHPELKKREGKVQRKELARSNGVDSYRLLVRWRNGGEEWVPVSRSEWSRAEEGTEVETMEDVKSGP